MFDRPLAVWLRTFAIGTVAGLVCARLHFPLPWLIGSMLAVAATGLFGFRTALPVRSRQLGQIVVGVSTGLYFTETLVLQVLDDIGLIFGASIASIVFSALVAQIIARRTAIDTTTAYFASLPGGVAEMSTLAERYGGDTAVVALSQSLRIVMVVLLIPPGIFYFGHEGSVAATSGGLSVHLLALAAMLAVGTVLAFAFGRLRLSNNWLLGGLVVGGLVAYHEIPLSSVPPSLIAFAQLLIGSALGTRINRDVVVRLRGVIPASAAGTLTIILFNVAVALLLAQLMEIDIATMILATAPGGVAETSLTAKALHLGVGTVTAFHLVRILFVVLFSVPIYRAGALVFGSRRDRPETR